jgi:hypothetical protein
MFDWIAEDARQDQPSRRTHMVFCRCFAAVIVLSCTVLGAGSVAGDAATGALYLSVDPYAGVDWSRVRQYRVNLHTHTTQSDGRLAPERVIDEYHTRGYHALAITDHDRCTWPWTAFDRDPAALNMLAVAGNELSRHHHALSLFTNFETQERDLNAALMGVAEAGGLAILCHPAMHWVHQYDVPPALRVSLAQALRRLTRDDFTIEAWFRTADTGRNVLLGNYSGGYAGALNLELHTDNRVRVFVQPSDAGKTVDINVSATPLGIDTRDGRWHHLAGVRQDGTVRLYLDGRLAGQSEDCAGPFELQGDALFIGRDTRTGSTVFKGDLSRIRLWRRALRQEEIAATVSATQVSTDGLLAQYLFSAAPGNVFADTAGSPAGPFHAEVSSDTAPRWIAEAPEALHAEEDAPGAVRFEPGAFPDSVPDATIEHYVALFARHRHLVGIEVLNRTRPDREIPLDRQLWDQLLTTLMPHRPVWGVATDDMHSMNHLGGDWVVLLAEELDERTARTGLADGRYYFASTRLHATTADVVRVPRIERVAHDAAAGCIAVTATVAGKPVSDRACTWISNGHTVHIGLTLPYRKMAGIGAYVRAEIAGDGGTTYTNPFGFVCLEP